MFLAKPDPKYKASFMKALSEYQSEGRYLEYFADELEKDFAKLCQKFEDNSQGKNLKPGYVPATTLWLINNDEFIGRVSIRHSLTDYLMKEGGHIGYDIRPSQRRHGYGFKILQMALPEAKKLGITKALLTCDSTNIASKTIIEKNAGMFENEVEVGNGMPPKLRYWIDLEKLKK